MLLQFSVKNFRSISDWSTLSLVPDVKLDRSDGKLRNVINVEGENRALRLAAVYGKNASGKSNLLLGLLAVRHLVTQGKRYDEDDDIKPYEPFLFDEERATAPCEMEVDFVGENGIRYKYNVSYLSKLILHEKLSFFPKKQPALLFERSHDFQADTHSVNFGEYFRGEKKYLKDGKYPNQTVLSKLKGEEYKNCREAYGFFNKIISFSTRSSIGQIELTEGVMIYSTVMILGKLRSEDEERYNRLVRSFVKILQSADTGIDWIEVIKADSAIASADGVNREKYQAFTHHYVTNSKGEQLTKKINLFDESTGTLKVFSLANAIISALTEDRLLIIDELDRSLHPSLTRLIMDIFLKGAKDDASFPKRKSQLVFTTHDSSLLDNKILRRDQVWFTDRDGNASTVLYCLADIKGVRKDTPFAEWYLSGKFGATPVTRGLEISEHEEDIQE